MKKITFLFATVILIAFFALSASALEPTGQCGDSAYWTFDENTGELVIGGSGKIYEDAFRYEKQITRVNILDGITIIGDYAFYDCTSLVNVGIPETVEKIEGNSLYDSYTFSGCNKLECITVDENNKHFSSDEFGVLFNKDKTTLIKYPNNSNQTIYTIPDSVKKLSSDAISNCPQLEELVLGENVYWGTTGTSYLSYPYLKFSDCPNLKKVIVNEKNPYFSSDDNGVVFNKDKTVIIYYPEGKEDTIYEIPQSVIMIGGHSISNNKKLESISIGENVKYIDYYAFFESGLKNIYISKNIEHIGSEAFAHTEKLENIEVSAENKYYCSVDGVLYNKTLDNLMMYPSQKKDKRYCVPDGVEKISYRSFDGATYLEKLYIPSTVTEIYHNVESIYSLNGVFSDCHKLREINVSNGNTTYCSVDGVLYSKDMSILLYCPINKLVAVYDIPDGVNKIAHSAFWNYGSWKRKSCIIVPDSIDTIWFPGLLFEHIGYEGTQDQWNQIYKVDNVVPKKLHCNFDFDKDAHIEIIEAPTCNESGFASFTCSCGYESVFEIQPIHKYDEGVVIKQPSHKEEGVKTFTCECGDTYSEVVAKIPHSYNKVVKAPTCTERGYTTYTCECGDSYINDYIDEKGHSHTSTITTEPTHLSEGLRTYTCSACGDSYQEAIAKTKEHSYVVLNIAEPTCETEGYTTYMCECGHTYNGDKKASTGHNYNGDTCVDCGESKIDNCSCNCHKGGFSGIIWKILRFFYKLFKMNPVCACGVSHY